MVRSHHRARIIDDDHRPANSTAIASDVHCVVVMIDINAHKLTDPSRASETAEVVDKSGRETSESNDCPIYVDDEGVGAIYLRSSGLADV